MTGETYLLPSQRPVPPRRRIGQKPHPAPRKKDTRRVALPDWIASQIRERLILAEEIGFTFTLSDGRRGTATPNEPVRIEGDPTPYRVPKGLPRLRFWLSGLLTEYWFFNRSALFDGLPLSRPPAGVRPDFRRRARILESLIEYAQKGGTVYSGIPQADLLAASAHQRIRLQSIAAGLLPVEFKP